MSDVVLGTMPAEDAARDAIHVAIIPMVAERILHPGERLEHGIVDPYLTHKVMPGERYWLCLYPNSVTGMRHHWSHPEFDGKAKPTKAESEAWLRDFCGKHDCPSYETIIKALTGQSVAYDGEPNDGYYRYTLNEEYFFFGGHDAHSEIPPEFWDHIENVLGHPPAHRPNQFSCSC